MAGRIGIMSRLMVAAFLMCAGMGSAAHAEKRVALVIGNSAYRAVPALVNPAADAKLMSDTLLKLGFFVVGGGAKLDLDKNGFDDALQKFGHGLTGADVALFYYAGHGVESHGLNYLVPVDAHPLDEADVFTQTTGISGLLYLYGKGVRRDYAEARRLFEQGSALGEPSAMNGLGAIYKDGAGVPRDLKVARQWFEKAAALGDPEARQN